MALLYVHLFYLAHSMHYVEIIETFVQNAQTLSGLPFNKYYRSMNDVMDWYIGVLLQRYEQLKPITEIVDPFLLKIIQNNTNNAGKEL